MDRRYLYQPSCIRYAEKIHRKGHKHPGVFVHAVYYAAFSVFIYETQKGNTDLQREKREG
jgi:hypothetical protein